MVHLLADVLVPRILALGRKQVQVEHLTCGSGHCALGNLLGLLDLLKINLEASLHRVLDHISHFFSFLGF